jgi:hypothetical protein
MRRTRAAFAALGSVLALALSRPLQPPALHAALRYAPGTGAGAYPQCKPDQTGPSTVQISFDCSSCVDGACAEGCCGGVIGDLQALYCKVGGCCARRLKTNDGIAVFVQEELSATGPGADGKCDLTTTDACGVACALGVGVGSDGNLGNNLNCTAAGFKLPAFSDPFSGDLACADGTAGRVPAPGRTEPASTGPPTATDSAGSTGKSSGGGPQTVVPSVTAKAGDRRGSACFPGDATVLLEGGGTRKMRDLAVGDRVHVGRGQFSDVFMFTHKVPEHAGAFVEITTVGGAVLRATSGHFLYVNGGLAAAGTVTAGDSVELGRGGVDVVARVSTATSTGLYNPQTLHGDVVVDGVRASTFTQAVEPAVAHALLAPLRAAWAVLGTSTTAFEAGSGVLGNPLPRAGNVC